MKARFNLTLKVFSVSLEITTHNNANLTKTSIAIEHKLSLSFLDHSEKIKESERGAGPLIFRATHDLTFKTN